MSTPFAFFEHLGPHDYYRFTKHYYQKMFDEMYLINFKGSNSIFTNPFLTFNILGFSIFPFFISGIISFFNNLLIWAIEKILLIFRRFFKKHKYIDFLDLYPQGYFFTFQKK